METRSITELHDANFELTNIFAMRQDWRKLGRFNMDHPRPTDALVYFHDCTAVYETPRHELSEVSRGSIIYIPHGAEYRTKFESLSPHSDSHTVLFEFLARDADGEIISVTQSDSPFIVEHGGSGGIYESFFKLADAYKSMNRSPAYIKSVAYGIIAELSRSEYISKLLSKKYSVIAQGIVYLEENYDKNPSVSELAHMCSVSESTFRELFKSYSGLSPSEYIAHGKTERAKRLLADGSLTVSEVAYTLGFSDSASFGRFFKKTAGTSPGKWQKKVNK